MEFLKDKVKEQLLRRISLSDSELSRVEVLSLLMGADPTRGKKYRNWIIDRYNKRDVLLEDLGVLRRELNIFTSMKKELSGDIGRLSISEFRLLVGGANDNGSIDLAKIKALCESEDVVAHSISNPIVVELKTLNASKYFSEGTSWCTSYEENFEAYSEIGPIYIVYLNGIKYQVHLETKQCMDINNDQASRARCWTIIELMYGIIRSPSLIQEYARNWPDKITPDDIVEMKKSPIATCHYAVWEKLCGNSIDGDLLDAIMVNPDESVSILIAYANGARGIVGVSEIESSLLINPKRNMNACLKYAELLGGWDELVPSLVEEEDVFKYLSSINDLKYESFKEILRRSNAEIEDLDNVFAKASSIARELYLSVDSLPKDKVPLNLVKGLFLFGRDDLGDCANYSSIIIILVSLKYLPSGNRRDLLISCSLLLSNVSLLITLIELPSEKFDRVFSSMGNIQYLVGRSFKTGTEAIDSTIDKNIKRLMDEL